MCACVCASFVSHTWARDRRDPMFRNSTEFTGFKSAELKDSLEDIASEKQASGRQLGAITRLDEMLMNVPTEPLMLWIDKVCLRGRFSFFCLVDAHTPHGFVLRQSNMFVWWVQADIEDNPETSTVENADATVGNSSYQRSDRRRSTFPVLQSGQQSGGLLEIPARINDSQCATPRHVQRRASHISPMSIYSPRSYIHPDLLLPGPHFLM